MTGHSAGIDCAEMDPKEFFYMAYQYIVATTVPYSWVRPSFQYAESRCGGVLVISERPAR